MFKTKVLAGLIMLTANLSFAQYSPPRDIDFEISTPYEVVDASSKDYFRQGDFVYSAKIQKKSIVIQKFDSEKMRQVYMKELPKPKANEIEGFYQIGDRLYLFYNLYNKGRKSEQLFYREINLDRGTWKGSPSILVATRGKVGGDIARTSYWGGFKKVNKFSINLSKDRSRLLVNYRMVPEEKNDKKSYDLIGLHVFDANLKEVWGEIVEMPYTEKDMNNIDYSVDSESNAYILTTVLDEDEREARKKDIPSYHVELLKKSPGKEKLGISRLDLGEKFIRTAWLYESPEEKMVCAGYYGNTRKNNSVDGIFYMKVDMDGKVYDAHDYEIPLEILNQYAGKRTQKRNNKREEKGEAQFYGLKLRNLKFHQDGSILLIGEQHYVVENTSRAGGVTTTTYTYYYNDVLVTKIDSEGNLDWMVKIPKRQRGSRGIGSMSFKHFYKDGYHYFMYLDNIKNQNLPMDESPSYHIDNTFGFLTAYVIDDKDGTSSTETILDMKEANGIKLYQFAPSRMIQMGDGEFLFEAYKKKKEDVMVKVHL